MLYVIIAVLIQMTPSYPSVTGSDRPIKGYNYHSAIMLVNVVVMSYARSAMIAHRSRFILCHYVVGTCTAARCGAGWPRHGAAAGQYRMDRWTRPRAGGLPRCHLADPGGCFLTRLTAVAGCAVLGALAWLWGPLLQAGGIHYMTTVWGCVSACFGLLWPLQPASNTHSVHFLHSVINDIWWWGYQWSYIFIYAMRMRSDRFLASWYFDVMFEV